MKVIVLAETLQKKLAFVNHAISSKNQLPILTAVFIEAKENIIVFRTTDLEIGIETSFSGEVEQEGSIAVPAKLFLELVNTLPQEKITLSADQANLHVLGKKMQASLPLMPKEEFPQLYDEKGENIFSIPAKEFKKNFGKVVFSTSTETTRPALSGVYVKGVEDKTTVVATDGYRLSLNIIQQGQFHAGKPVIIPSRLIREAFTFSEEGNLDFYLLEKDKQVIFVHNEDLLIGRFIDVEFPHYQKILPTDLATKATFEREEFSRAIKTSAIFARDAANVIVVSILKDKLVISAKNSASGGDTVDIEAQVTGEENEIAFNAKYLLDFLHNVSEEQLTFEMNGPLNPAIFSSPQTPDFLHLIMPIRT